MGHYSTEIIRNAEKINLLHARIRETYALRDRNPHKWKEWQQACADFHARYDALAFPGGLTGAYQKIVEGDPQAIEAAISYLEARPYCFRSGYIWKNLLRKSKRAPLDADQRARLDRVITAYKAYRQSRKVHKP